jgi:hypothetical protein
MNRLLLSPFLCLLISAALTGQSNPKWKPIELGDYVLDFPPDFKLTPANGIDSYVGKIDGDSLHLQFDFGYYSPSFGQTPQEYLKQGFWKTEAGYRFMKRWRSYSGSNWPKVEVLAVRPAIREDSILGSGCDYVARCKHKNKEFDYAIYLPSETKDYDFVIDSTSNFYRKIVLAKIPQKGATGLYIRELTQSNKSVNSYLALSVFATNLTKSQQEIIEKIYKTARLSNK